MLNVLFILEIAAVHHRKMNAERIVYVNARKQVRRCVSGVKPLAKRCKHIVVREIIRP